MKTAFMPCELPCQGRQSPLPFASLAFGLRWGSDRPLRQFAHVATSGEPYDVAVVRTADLVNRGRGRLVNNGELYADGARFRFGDAVFDTYGEDRVTWWSQSGHEVPQAFFGTVAAIILAWRRLVPLHASAVAIQGQALLIAGSAGAGKSTLCEALIRRRGRLISDDLTAMLPIPRGEKPMLQPGRPAIRLAKAGGEQAGEKGLYKPPMVNLFQPVPAVALVVLRDAPLSSGPVEATETLRAQLFRPRWMRALPHFKDRERTIFHAAQRMMMFVAPSARCQPDMSVDEKADFVLNRLHDAKLWEPRRC